MQPPAERGGPLPGGESAFLGRAVSRYDVDELDDLGRRPRLERCVEVRRPDGTVAKSRGERTFYGAFTGGFSAGYWNTVGSAEGWQPASFSSSRGRREQAPAPRVEDYMDEEDLREHHASHRGVEVRAEFAPHGTGPAAASRPCAVPGGLPREVKEQVFGLKEGRIGARLLSAAASSAEPSSPALPIAEKASRPQAVDGALSKGKRRYGCAPPPPGFMPQTASELPADTTGGAESARSVLAVRHVSTSAHLITGPSGRWPFEADVERLWQGKTDLHGIGYGAAGTDRSVQQLPQHRRLYLSNKKRPHGGDASDYGAFGTGVFDMEDYDVWEDIYSKSGMPCEHEILSEPETSQEGPQAAALGPATPSALPSVSPEGCIAGFVQSKDVEDGRPDRSEWAEWELPEVPRSFRDVHIYPGTWAEEAEAGSPEHRRLLAFLEEHGRGRLLDPASRAELLGERPRGPAKAPPAEAAGGSGPSAAGAASAAGGPAPARQGAASTAEGAAAADAGPAAAAAASGPLWRGVTEEQKRALLQSLGRQFVVGRDQDMDGHLGRHEPFIGGRLSSMMPQDAEVLQWLQCSEMEAIAEESVIIEETKAKEEGDHLVEEAKELQKAPESADAKEIEEEAEAEEQKQNCRDVDKHGESEVVEEGNHRDEETMRNKQQLPQVEAQEEEQEEAEKDKGEEEDRQQQPEIEENGREDEGRAEDRQQQESVEENEEAEQEREDVNAEEEVREEEVRQGEVRGEQRQDTEEDQQERQADERKEGVREEGGKPEPVREDESDGEREADQRDEEKREEGKGEEEKNLEDEKVDEEREAEQRREVNKAQHEDRLDKEEAERQEEEEEQGAGQQRQVPNREDEDLERAEEEMRVRWMRSEWKIMKLQRIWRTWRKGETKVAIEPEKRATPRLLDERCGVKPRSEGDEPTREQQSRVQRDGEAITPERQRIPEMQASAPQQDQRDAGLTSGGNEAKPQELRLHQDRASQGTVSAAACMEASASAPPSVDVPVVGMSSTCSSSMRATAEAGGSSREPSSSSRPASQTPAIRVVHPTAPPPRRAVRSPARLAEAVAGIRKSSPRPPLMSPRRPWGSWGISRHVPVQGRSAQGCAQLLQATEAASIVAPASPGSPVGSRWGEAASLRLSGAADMLPPEQPPPVAFRRVTPAAPI